MHPSNSGPQATLVKSQIPLVTGQVIDQIDKLQFALDTQYDIIQSLLRRVEPVTGNLLNPVETAWVADPQTASFMVPIASRIQWIVERIQSGNSDLDRILSNLQI